MLAVAGILLFWLLAAGWLTAPLLAWAQADIPATGTANFSPDTAIIMLGSGTEYDNQGTLVPKHDALLRIVTSAALYRQCKQVATRRCTVIVSGGNPQRHTASEADTYLPWLLRDQVPRADIVLENRSRTTYENARFVTDIVKRADYSALILVTSAYQIPRALLDFRRFGLTPQPAISNARHANLGVLPRYDNLVNAEIALHELIGIAQFHVYREIGWF
ncbi:YdcF family protein [Paraburkholderia megapolitana]|uniref:DUF218 domain-containing protein n=1 Tax=Paraburkholderia megapolitana TaxID=420953 RepID=A0A1I3R3U3_9BURK|nr:YdcF family protein [Paraburkholderia megapolitana]QDQ83692.1 YdcF family protein [Paraburkholderia megapolitana]SFJ41234.1 DUF218 domain-containing protein [Paraburkholderia megapolitana]